MPIGGSTGCLSGFLGFTSDSPAQDGASEGTLRSSVGGVPSGGLYECPNWYWRIGRAESFPAPAGTAGSFSGWAGLPSCAFAIISDLFGTRPLEQATAQEAKEPAKEPAAPNVEVAPPPAPALHGVQYPFRSGQDRLSRMPGIPGPIGSTPIPSPEQLKELQRFFPGPPVDPQFTIDLVQDRIRLFRLAAPPTQTQLGNPSIVGFNLLTPR